MVSYIHSGSVVWIPSRIYFAFWIQRIEEIKDLQTKVARIRPSNGCNLTLLNMYLIKSIVTKPFEDSHTRAILQDLNFHPSSQHFGIFFLPDIDPDTLSVFQMEHDSDAVIEFVTKIPGKRKAQPQNAMEDSRKSVEFPLGTHPTWQEITELLDSNPQHLVKPTLSQLQFWIGPLVPLDSLVINLLIKWTRQYMFTMNEVFLKDQNNYPVLGSWKDILLFWTVSNICNLVHAPAFKPHNYGVQEFWLKRDYCAGIPYCVFSEQP